MGTQEYQITVLSRVCTNPALVLGLVERDHRFQNREYVAVAVVRRHVIHKHDKKVRVVAGVETRLRVRVEEADDKVALAQGHRQNEVDL